MKSHQQMKDCSHFTSIVQSVVVVPISPCSRDLVLLNNPLAALDLLHNFSNLPAIWIPWKADHFRCEIPKITKCLQYSSEERNIHTKDSCSLRRDCDVCSGAGTDPKKQATILQANQTRKKQRLLFTLHKTLHKTLASMTTLQFHCVSPRRFSGFNPSYWISKVTLEHGPQGQGQKRPNWQQPPSMVTRSRPS